MVQEEEKTKKSHAFSISIIVLSIYSLLIFLEPKILNYTNIIPSEISYWIKISLCTIVLIFSSISDFKKMEVTDNATVALIYIYLLDYRLENLCSGLICFSVFFLVAMITSLGGADCKIVFGVTINMIIPYSLFALLIGLSVSIVFQVIIKLVKKDDYSVKFPLVPYLTTGFIALTILKEVIFLWKF